jgi:trimeric autotransporter adhesin
MMTLIRILLSCLFSIQLSLSCLAQSGIITTYVGLALPTDGAMATTQSLDGPASIALDKLGGFYVSCQHLNAIYYVAADGRLRLVAGNGAPGYSGDGGKATGGRLRNPNGIAVDSAGNLYIADTYNYRIRKVSPDGIITTIAGNGTRGYSGDGGKATKAQLDRPNGVAVDPAGNIYIADTENHRIRKVTPAGKITTVAGNGKWGSDGDAGKATRAQLTMPHGITIDAAGNLYFSDLGIIGRHGIFTSRIRKMTPAGIITTVAGNDAVGYRGDGGDARLALLNSPEGVTVDSVGNIYIADSDNHCIRKVSSDGIITTIAGSAEWSYSGDDSRAASAELRRPTGIAADAAGNLYIADASDNRIRKVTPDSVIITAAGNGTSELFSRFSGRLGRDGQDKESSVTVDSGGNLYVADAWHDRIRKVAPDGVITTIAGDGTTGHEGDGSQVALLRLNNPRDVTVDSAGNLYFAETDGHRICKITPDGVISIVAGNGDEGFYGDGGKATSAPLLGPRGVVVDSGGNLYIADSWADRIRKVAFDGVISTIAGNGKRGYSGDGKKAVLAKLGRPTGIAVDSAGNLYIADASNNRIRKVNPDGVITTVVGNGTQGFSGDGGRAIKAKLNFPLGIAADAAGILYIADTGNHRIRKVTPDGIITTVAGDGTVGYSGDGGQAVSAQLAEPAGIAVDSKGILYIADSGNHRIRKVQQF